MVSPGFEHEVQADEDWVCATQAPAAPWVAVEVELTAAPGPVAGGLVAADGHLIATYDPDAGRVALEVRVDGQPARVLRRRRTRRPRRLAFILCGHRLAVLVDSGRGWRLALTAPPRALTPLVDPADPARLASYRLGWRGAEEGRAGPFGLVGIRDLHLVQHRDGAPYERDGRLLLSATCAGLGGFHEAHWGVFVFDPHTYELVPVAHLFTQRDGRVLGDHAGHVVVDEPSGTCEVLVSSWGDFDAERGVHTRRITTGLDVLAGVHVLATQEMALPTRHSTWDPGATLVDGRWRVSYVRSPSQAPFDFAPALAHGLTLDSLESVGVDAQRHQCEGPVLARVDGSWRLLTSDGDARCYPAYDLTLRPVGRLAAPYGSNIPHPQLVPAPDGATLLVTFDGTPWPAQPRGLARRLPYGTHGDLVVLRAEPGAALIRG